MICIEECIHFLGRASSVTYIYIYIDKRTRVDMYIVHPSEVLYFIKQIVVIMTFFVMMFK